MNHPHRTSSSTSPLASTAIEVTISDLLAEYEVRHGFRNDGSDAIEAIYSFPTPLDAAFLGMQATLGDETLVARVLPAKSATREYDDAIAGGDSAVLVEQVEPGMLCISLGSLKAGESGEIVLRFTAALGVAGRIARFSLPLVHRPRYGRRKLYEISASSAHDFAVEHPLTARIRVRGLLADRSVQCTSHGARFQRDGGETLLDLDHAMLDRDLVLTFDLGKESVSSLRRIEDGERSIGVLNFVVPETASPVTAPRDICLLLDGSGSMQGDAITQSRAALRAVADELRSEDRIQVIRFGDRAVELFRRPLRASERVRAALGDLTHTINASMGGTEMAFALRRAIDMLNSLDGPSQQKVIILVTDGAVYASTLADVTRDAIDAGIRVFVVAVGSSAGVDALQPLATATNATLERAVPAEPIDAGVLRQLRRAREPGPLAITLDWGQGAASLPHGVAYPGDAATALAFLPDNTERTVRVHLPGSEQTFVLDADHTETSAAWRAWAGQQAHRHAAPAEREAIALRHGLITDETSAVLVKIRAEDQKADGLPLVVPVAHMLPDGMMFSRVAAPAPVGRRVLCAAPALDFDLDKDGRYDMPACLRRTDDDTSAQGATEPPLSEDRIRHIEESLLRALHALLLTNERNGIDFDLLLAAIDPDLHHDTKRHLKETGSMFNEITGAVRLFEQLLARHPGTVAELTDDQEARLAVVRHPNL